MAKFTKGSIEFLTIAIEFCKFIESISSDNEGAKKKLSLLLPLLYLKAAMVETGSMIYDEEPEKFVDENDYNMVCEDIAAMMGNDNQYLTATHPDIALSDSVVAASISEDIADIYQAVKDFTSASQIGNEDIMNDALIVCINEFNAFWGTRLLSAQLAIHQSIVNSFEKEEQPTTNANPLFYY